jgi:glucose-1-phosphate thymidylyltransferase
MKGIKGIILAGGKGTRLYPLTKVTNKHLLPLGGEIMINYPIKCLVSAGIKDIMIVTGVEHCGAMMTFLGSGKEYGCSFTYKIQDHPDGIGGALKLCQDFVGTSDCIVILGDNIFTEDLSPAIEMFTNKSCDSLLFFKKVNDPSRYGVGTFKDNKLICLEEKPENPVSNLACVGIYIYTNAVFNILNTITPSSRGEYEITAVNNHFVENNSCEYIILTGEWSDAGTMSSYHKTNIMLSNDKEMKNK